MQPYLGHVHIDRKLKKWISRHPYASQDWLSGQIIFGAWEPKSNHYQVIAETEYKSEEIRVRIKLTHHPNGGPEYPTDYVHVYGAHTVGSKKRRR